jgi:hypothetical protein
MPGHRFGEGDACSLSLLVSNPGTEQAVDLYLLLDVYGSYWSYPSWQPLASGPDWESRVVDSGADDSWPLISEFIMPQVSPSGPLFFYAAMFRPQELSLDALVSNGAIWEFSLE